ncbi:hypothetical protein [Spiroplasma endosymbiont of Tricholauxania praeusta]|uniref:hypothetical protein n=1 Tax=Spiroplasma endosymbiont of Tricholauxania praeusta TaxID=3066296 RepID=UPI0030CCCEC6
MRNIKTLLRLMAATTLITTVASSIVACDFETKGPILNGKYAKLLGWYSDENTSLINQELKRDKTTGKEKYSIEADDTKIMMTNFKNSLLNANEIRNPNQAKDADAAAFLKELGITSGSENEEYSSDDVKKITTLSAKITSTEAGKTEENNTGTDFKVLAGTCQIDIISKDDDSVVKSYTINTSKNDGLNISKIVITKLISDKNSLKLTAAQGFKQGDSVADFKLVINSESKQKQFDSLVQILNTNVSTQFYARVDDGPLVTGNFRNLKVYLAIYFGDVHLLPRIDCGIPPTV